MSNKHRFTYGDMRGLTRTKPCKYCNGTGYRLVHRHIEVECTRCKGHGFVVTHVIKDKLNKDPRE